MDLRISECSASLDLPSTVILVLGYSLPGIISIIGNSLVLWAIYRFHNLRTPSNYLLASLAAADLSVGLLIEPLWVARCIVEQKPYDHPFQVIIGFFWLQTTVITTFNLCAVTIDRYIAVLYTLKYPSYMTSTRSLAIICVIWTFSIGFANLRVFITSINSLPSLWTSSFVLTFIIPLVVIVLSYAKILKEARKQVRQISQQEVESSERQPPQASNTGVMKKANTTVGIIIALFIVLWLPCLVTSFIQHFVSDSEECLQNKLRIAWLWVEMVAFLSSAINPWIYAVRNRDFREAFQSKFCTV